MIRRGNHQTGAVYSDCELYRYKLWRRWTDAKRPLVVIGLNPSTATEFADDPTIRRCIRFAQRDNYGGLVMLNLFAYRSTDPKGLLSVADPVGPDNNATLWQYINFAFEDDGPVAAWGTQSSIPKVAARARELYEYRTNGGVLAVTVLRCFGKAKDGSPRHPLYLKADTPIVSLQGCNHAKQA